jgi:hypothetical protein
LSFARDLAGRFLSSENAEFAETGFVWWPVSSSNVAAVGYNEQRETLGVRFLNGSEYEYSGVDKDMALALRDATSVGKFLHAFIKGRYPYERVA